MARTRQGARRMWLGLVAMGCAATPPMREADPVMPEDAELGGGCAGSTASGVCESAARDNPFVLETKLTALRRRDGRTMNLVLGNGATVIDGDRLKVFLRASQDGYLYVAFCSQNARDPRYHGLKVFPEDGAIRVRAQQMTIAPDPMADIVLDDRPGPEALYLILSRRELSHADAELAQVIADARQGHESADCGEPFQRAITGPRKKTSERRVTHLGGSGAPPVQPRRTRPKASSPSPPASEADPVVEIQRGGDVVWNHGAMGVAADPDGIVVLRYRLTHVAAP
jgi:hypothetical protein